MTSLVWLIVILALAGGAAYGAQRYLVRRVVIGEWQWGLLYRDGKLQQPLATGPHWLFKPRDRVAFFDRRRTLAYILGQEVLTSDSIGIKLSLVAEYRIVDAVKMVTAVADHREQVHIALQTALRQAVAGRTLDVLLAGRGDIAGEARTAAASGLEAIGLAVDGAWLRDIMLSKELRSSYADVVTAKKEGEAALERARGESAALRNLANAAKLLKNNPDLINLRLLQAVSAGRGAAPTFVVGIPQAGEDLAARAASAPEAPSDADA
jgi:regulator of protease activity HflC (stomatin/prohibitin superfamily)